MTDHVNALNQFKFYLDTQLSSLNVLDKPVFEISKIKGTDERFFKASIEFTADSNIEALQTRVMSFCNKSGFTADINPGNRGEEILQLVLTVIEDSVLQDLRENGKLEYYSQVMQLFFEQELKKRAPKRKQNELPDPSKPASASVNNRATRTTKQFNADISPDTINLIADFKNKSGLTKRQIIENAVSEYIANHEKDFE